MILFATNGHDADLISIKSHIFICESVPPLKTRYAPKSDRRGLFRAGPCQRADDLSGAFLGEGKLPGGDMQELDRQLSEITFDT